jgi:uncharacterized protein YndB with AHSA1/START domain
MRAPDGTVYPMGGEFLEIDEPRKLVFVSAALDGAGQPIFSILNTVTFAESDAQTTLRLEARVISATTGAAHYLDGMEAGWTQSLGRLDRHMAGPGSEREIVISRIFAAPRELVWAVWTDPKQVVRWWGPRGFTTTIEKMDVRPGGEWKHVMRGPDGAEYPNESVFTEVVKPERIRFSQGGAKRGEAKVGFEATWTFEALGDRTRLTVRMVFPTAAARERVVRDYGALEGANQTMDRLSEILAAQTA